jgi:UDP-N-acetylmuramoyl-L-alanyl-D-glutamate--2,6-diaminopimelate ligase
MNNRVGMKTKYLNELLDPDLMVKQQTIERLLINKVVYDSRKVEDQSLFVAIHGYSTDGHNYLKDVQNLGAVAAIVEKINPEVIIPQYQVKDCRIALASIASEFYRPELDNMRVVGITGTNGKTTTSFLIRSILNEARLYSGLIGTIHYDIGGELIQAWNTTPESVDLFQMIYDMHQQDQRGCVLEASSHGLALHRLDGIKFEIAVFTNLSQDHLDFHADFEDYYQAKKSLFSHLKPEGSAIINSDDSYGQRLLSEIESKYIDFNSSGNAAVTATHWDSSLSGVTFLAQTPQGQINITSPLIGKFNIENILAAISTGIALGIDLVTIKRGIESVHRVTGRLEPVPVDIDKTIIVDYAHTPDALEKALRVLAEMTDNNLWVVFGCGGDRDKKKRPLMGRIAMQIANRVIITSDNPRSESPGSIIDEILEGINDNKKIEVESNRQKAIQMALKNASAGDTILVAGKGHENYQEINGIKYPFDDRQVIRESVR